MVADICAGSGTTARWRLSIRAAALSAVENAPAIYGPAVQRIEQARLAVERGRERSVIIGAYSIIYADPPWRYSQKNLQGGGGASLPNHESIDELCALPVPILRPPDSALFLWATFPQLPEALRLIREWGFTYKSVAFVCSRKTARRIAGFTVLGFWTRANAEVCLLATRGPPSGRQPTSTSLLFRPSRPQQKAGRGPGQNCGSHGRSAPCGAVSPGRPPPGWDVWGNEVQSTLRDFGDKLSKEGG